MTLVDVRGSEVVAVTCTRCEKQMTPEEWARLELGGYVGHWRAHGKLFAIEIRNCTCGSTLGVECAEPPMKGTEEVTMTDPIRIEVDAEDRLFLYELTEGLEPRKNRWAAQVRAQNGLPVERAHEVAKLFRAAPDMLEALEEYVGINDDLVKRGSMPAEEADRRREVAWSKMRGAIAKARSGT